VSERDWSVRPARESDLDAIMALETAIFVNDAWSPSAMHSELTGEHGFYLVAEQGGRVVGYAGLRAPRGAQDADVQTIAVASDARGLGLGRELMHRLIGEARDRRALKVFLEVRADNPRAHGLYRSLGFDDIAVRPRYYQPDDVDAIVMALELSAHAATAEGERA
jgi:ribosomal-protein-alanine acetyltransferase